MRGGLTDPVDNKTDLSTPVENEDAGSESDAGDDAAPGTENGAGNDDGASGAENGAGKDDTASGAENGSGDEDAAQPGADERHEEDETLPDAGGEGADDGDSQEPEAGKKMKKKKVSRPFEKTA